MSVATGFTPLKTREDYRLFFHSLVLAGVPALVVFGVGTASQWAGWTAVGLAALDALLSFTNTADGLRKVIYALGGVAQTALLALGSWSESDVTLKVGAVVTFLTALVAIFYTPNSAVASG